MSEKINEKDLILIDEPDQSLYPTSAKYLRDELLKISKKSKVIYSTHSQYMIDTDNLDRHIVVEKVDDITILKKEDNKSPYIEDELLKRAIGAGIFECLKPINIIFEGYLDKKLFEKYCEFYKNKNLFNDYGKIFSAGHSGFELLISLLESINKKFIIVADSDNPSNTKRKKLEEEAEFFDFKLNWLAYGDVENSIVTMEDFFDKNFVKSEIVKINKDYVYDDSKNAIYNIDQASKNDSKIKQVIKNNIVKNFEKKDINDSYINYINELEKKLVDIK
jgi:predicted ATP-dependent endonuclease of OLD family